MSTGLLILRVVVGGIFLGHGTQKLFGWFGGGGIRGTGQFLDSAGYRPGPAMAAVNGLAETGGGLFLVVGLLTPLASAAIVGVMLNAIVAVHWRNGFWNSKQGMEFPLSVAAGALAVAFTGPGRISLDRALGWHLRGVAWGIGSLGIALVVGGIALGLRELALRSDGTGEGPTAGTTDAA